MTALPERVLKDTAGQVQPGPSSDDVGGGYTAGSLEEWQESSRAPGQGDPRWEWLAPGPELTWVEL